jgi:hypothetical protein
MTVFRIAGGITFILIGIAAFGFNPIPTWFLGIAAVLAGLALLAGF